MGDVILKLNRKDVTDANTLRNEVAGISPGTDITLTISRNGNQQDMRARLSELTPQAAQRAQQGGTGNGQKLGITVAPLTPDLAAQVGVPRGTHGVWWSPMSIRPDPRRRPAYKRAM